MGLIGNDVYTYKMMTMQRHKIITNFTYIQPFLESVCSDFANGFKKRSMSQRPANSKISFRILTVSMVMSLMYHVHDITKQTSSYKGVH